MGGCIFINVSNVKLGAFTFSRNFIYCPGFLERFIRKESFEVGLQCGISLNADL